MLTIDVGTESAEYVYTITDPDGLSSTAVATIISVPNRAPEPEAFTVETEFDEPMTIDVDEHVADPDGDEMLFACCDSVRHGRATIVDTGEGSLAVEFTPDDGFTGEAGFAYQVDDQNGHVTVGASWCRSCRPPTGHRWSRTARPRWRRAPTGSCRSTARRRIPTPPPATA